MDGWVGDLAADWAWDEARRGVLAPVVEIRYSREGSSLVEPLVRAAVARMRGPVALGGEFSSFDFDVYRPRTRSSAPPVHGVDLWGAKVLERGAGYEESRVGHSLLWWCAGSYEGVAEVRHDDRVVELGPRELGVLPVLADTSASPGELAQARDVLFAVLGALEVTPAVVPPRVAVALERASCVNELERRAAALTLVPFVRSGVARSDEEEQALIVGLLRHWLPTEALLEAYTTILGDTSAGALTAASALATALALEEG